MNQKSIKKHKGGRKPKLNPAVYRYTVNLNAEENARFCSLLQDSGMKNISRFIASVLLNKPIKVIKIDRNTYDYYTKLSGFYSQYQSIGVNYNQIVKALKSNFSEKKAVYMLGKLHKETADLISITSELIKLTKEYEAKYLSK